jgi:Rieske 2Fe-2S family protein
MASAERGVSAPEVKVPAHNGLLEPTPSLPVEAYYDAQQYQLELQRIWHRNWIYLCRSSELKAARAFRTFELAGQNVLVLRDEHGALQAFHNTCRHRGAALCREPRGTLRTGAIVCPYHAWVYDLKGDLLRTSSRSAAAGFDVADFPLYRLPVREWNGFIFISLSDSPPPFERLFDVPSHRLDAWDLPTLEVAHVFERVMECNWKIYWENYNECLHCPMVHPQLSQLVPIYSRGYMEERDDPNWSAHLADPDPKFKGGVRAGAVTWSLDGQLTGTAFPRLSEEDRRLGYVFMTGLPSVFMVGHVDYIRVVRVRPLAPERTELRVEYLFAPQSLARPGFDARNAVDFTDTVMREDAEVCELNQAGLHAIAHAQGVLMPEEYALRQFHQWIASELARP